MRSKLKLSLIANNYLRKQRFKRRKEGITKKLHEFTTLCGVKACAVICSPYENPVLWPSAEGVQEVVSKVMELPVEDQCKKMFNHESYLRREITKAEKQVEKLRSDNRETQLRQFMFDCLEGKMNQHPYDATDLQDLRSYIGSYIKKLDFRMKVLTEENGESSSSTLLLPSSVAGADSPAVEVTGHPGVADASMVTDFNGFDGYFPYDGMTMNPIPNQHESLVQHHVPVGSVQHHVPVGSVQHHTPMNLDDQIQHGIYDMNLHQDMSLDPNQYPYPQGSFMNLLLGHPQEMGYDGEHAHIPFVNDNYHQLPTIDLATTEQMGYDKEHESLVQHHVPVGSVQHHVPVGSAEYHTPMNFDDQIQHGIYDMNLHQDMSLDPVQPSYPQGSFMNLLMGHPQQMGYDEEHAHNPLMNGNYHQLPTMDFASTGHMPSINTNTIAGVYAPDDINGL